MATPGGSAALKSLEEEVKCPLCIEIFIEPKKLPCDHVICRLCLQTLIFRSTDQSLTCPVCRDTTPIEGPDVSQFPSAHHVNRLIDIYQQTLKENQQTLKENQQILKDLQILKEHQQTQEKHQQPQATVSATTEQQQLCSVHTAQPLALYCETCKKTVCRDCALTQCSDGKHSYGFIKDMAIKYKGDVERIIAPIRTLQQDIKDALEAIAENNEKLELERQKEECATEEAFENFKTKLEREKSQILSVINEKFRLRASRNTSRTDELCANLKLLDENIQLVESMSSADSFMSELDLVFSQTKKLLEMHGTFRTLSLETEEYSDIQPKITFIPDDLRNFLFHDGNGYRCSLDEYYRLNSLRLKELHQADLLITPEPTETKITATLVSISDESSTPVAVKKICGNRYRLFILPQKRGRHKIVLHQQNRANVYGSPLSAFVHINPRQISLLGKQNKPFPIHDAVKVKCYDRKVYVSSLRTEVLVLEHTKTNLTITKRIPLYGVYDFLIWDKEIYFINELDDKVEKASLDGRRVTSVGGHGSQPGCFDFPNQIKINKKTEIFVCDTDNHRIQVFDTSLKLLRILKCSDNSGQPEYPYDIDFDEDGNIYIIECRNNRVHIVTPQGEHLKYICNSGKNRLVRPTAACIHNGHIYIVNSIKQCISVFTLNGDFVTSIGDRDGLKPGGIDIDEDGYVYVTSARKALFRY